MYFSKIVTSRFKYVRGMYYWKTNNIIRGFSKFLTCIIYFESILCAPIVPFYLSIKQNYKMIDIK